MAVSLEAKVARDILYSREKAYRNYNKSMGVDRNGTIDVENLDLHNQVKLGLKKLVDEASTKFKAIQVKDVGTRNAQAHRTHQKVLEAQANDRKTRQKEVDKNNEENIRKHYGKKAAATATAAAGILGDNFASAFSNAVAIATTPLNPVECTIVPGTAVEVVVAALIAATVEVATAVEAVVIPLIAVANTATVKAVAAPLIAASNAVTPTTAIMTAVDAVATPLTAVDSVAAPSTSAANVNATTPVNAITLANSVTPTITPTITATVTTVAAAAATPEVDNEEDINPTVLPTNASIINTGLQLQGNGDCASYNQSHAKAVAPLNDAATNEEVMEKTSSKPSELPTPPLNDVT